MKKLIIAASVMLLAACSSPQPPQLKLAPQATLSTNAIVQNKTYNLLSKDVRAAQYVALVDSGRGNIQPLHTNRNLRLTLENALADQFSSQGFKTEVKSNNTIELQIQEALINIKQTILESNMDAKLVLQVTAKTPRGELVKTYTGTAKRTSGLSASDEEIEQTLNDVVNLTLKDIANDKELQKYMQERF